MREKDFNQKMEGNKKVGEFQNFRNWPEPKRGGSFGNPISSLIIGKRALKIYFGIQGFGKAF